MRKFERLKKEARQAAKGRGHKLPLFQKLSTTTARAVCPCGAVVVVRTKPAANEIDIGGDAVAVNCKL